MVGRALCLCCVPQGAVLSAVLDVNTAAQPRTLSSLTHEHNT